MMRISKHGTWLSWAVVITVPLCVFVALEQLRPLPFATSNGNNVAVYFRTRQNELGEGGHVYRNSFNGTTWRFTTSGDPDPILVDAFNPKTNLFPGQDLGYYVFPPDTNSANTLTGTLVIWIKPEVDDVAIGLSRQMFFAEQN